MDAWADAAGVVLAGGRSSRMGTSKAAMEWHGSTLLYRTAALLGRTVGGPVVVVSAVEQELPPLPDGVRVVTDPVPGLGPLQGIGAGLGAVAGAAEIAFVCSTDLPFLHPAFVRRVLSALAPATPERPTADRATAGRTAPDHTAADPTAADPAAADRAAAGRAALAAADSAGMGGSGSDAGQGAGGRPIEVALPFARGYRQPLAAGYRTALAEPIAALLEAGKLRPGMLFERSHVVELDDAALLADPELARLDPGLESVTNVNEPADYAAARARPPEPVTVETAGGRHQVRAAMLGAAAAAVGIAVTGDLAVFLNGCRVDPDPHLPLVAGDTVVLEG